MDTPVDHERSPMVLLAARNLAKRFGATQAVRSAGLTLRAGEVHAVVGENGSGKSTLIKMLSGVHVPDSGVIEVRSTPVRLRSPRDALAAGTVTVFQEVLVAGACSVIDNLWSGTDGVLRAHRGANERERLATTALAELLVDPPALEAVVEQLPLATRQACAIARALLREPRVLILDEATSSLDVETAERLFEYLGKFTSRGGAVLFTSHRMDEVTRMADYVTVMRDGVAVASLRGAEASPAELVRLMVGGEVQRVGSGHRDSVATEREVLRARGVELGVGVAPFDFTLREGEIVGLAGLEGHGQDAFLQRLWGGPGTGEITVLGQGETVPIRSAREATRHGVVYVPRDRRGEALFPTQSILDNFGLPTLAKDTRFGLLRPARTAKRFHAYASTLGTRFGAVHDDITTLSGGNQQKVIIARWLATDPRVLLLNDPTRGVDINVKRDLYELLDLLTRNGVAVVLLSTELDEHLALADRVLVFHENGVAAELRAGELTRERMVGAFFGRNQVDGYA